MGSSFPCARLQLVYGKLNARSYRAICEITTLVNLLDTHVVGNSLRDFGVDSRWRLPGHPSNYIHATDAARGGTRNLCDLATVHQ